MAHQAQRDFIALVARLLPHFFRQCKVLEVGSLNINGTVRDFFDRCNYTGIDVAPGRDVDTVCQGQNFNAPDNSYDHVISCEAMEHNPYWAETFRNMVRLCRPGGLVLMTCATIGRSEHGTTRTSPEDSPLTISIKWDYYKNLSERHFAKRINLHELFGVHKFWTNWRIYDLYFCGIKKGHYDESSWGTFVNAMDRYITSENHESLNGARVATYFGDIGFNVIRALRDHVK